MSSIKRVFDTEIAARGKTTQNPVMNRRPRSSSHGQNAEGVLGVNAKFTSARDLKRETRRRRWSRLSSARELLKDKDVGKRVTKCMWVQIAFTVEQWRIENVKGSSHFRSVSTCKSVWLCAICAAKITEGRKEELQIAVAEATKRGWHVYMITYTLQHGNYEPIKAVLDKLIKACSKLKGRRFWDRFTEKYGLLKASITALEMTYSFLNGGHPHKHVMEFSSRKLSKEEQQSMRDELALEYKKILSKLGGYADFEIAVNVRDGNDFIAEYLAKFGYEPKEKNKTKKWGLAEEMAKFPVSSKGNLEGHYSVFQLLDLYADGNADAGKVFVEFARAFFRKSQLSWSDGLKKEFGIKQKTDGELVDEKVNESKVFALFQKESWHKVRKIPFEVLEAGDMTFPAFKEYLKAKDIEVENPIFEIIDNGFGDDSRGAQ